jgi:hypothetical protein
MNQAKRKFEPFRRADCHQGVVLDDEAIDQNPGL